MEQGKITYEETVKDDGSIVIHATYHLSDDEKEFIDSLTDEECEQLMKELKYQLNKEYRRRINGKLDEFTNYLLFG